MDKRFQVFVSSTYEDLQEERQEVMHALLELDSIPSGMELFPAANESQWSLIKKVIEDCDYYVLVIGGRYGSKGPDGISYTEMEYRHALQIDKPTIAFLHKDPGSMPASKSEGAPDGKEKLAAFRDLAQKKHAKFWSNPADLGSVVSRSLIQLTKSHPAVGWVRANELPDREASLELLRLRKQVDDLTVELQRVRTTAPQGTESLTQGADRFKIRYSFVASDGAFGFNDWNGSFGPSWNEIFAALARGMIHELSEEQLKHEFNTFIRMTEKPVLEAEGSEPIVDAKRFTIHESDFQTVKVQLRALGFIVRSEKQRSVKDVGTYWKLTPYGDDLMTRLRAIKRLGSSDSTTRFAS